MAKSKKRASPKKGAKRAPAKRSAAAAKREREVYKVSPLRGMSLDEYIGKKLAGWQADATRRLVQLVRRAAPSAQAAIKWGQPIFEENGPFAFIKPAKAHLSFGFWRGAQLTDPTGALECGDRMGHVKLRSPEAIDERWLEALVREAVALNKKLGSPTKRS
jgi:hypothetical protein